VFILYFEFDIKLV